jgi:hypothetical protein
MVLAGIGGAGNGGYCEDDTFSLPPLDKAFFGWNAVYCDPNYAWIEGACRGLSRLKC